MSKKKIVYILSDIDKALAFEWITRELSRKYELFFLLIGNENSQFEAYLTRINIRYALITDTPTQSFLEKWLKVFLILRKEKPHVIHAHLWRAMLLGLSVAWVLRINKRIFTRHHAIIHYRDYPSGLKWDRLCNWLATDIVAISENIKKILIHWDGAVRKKIHVIHHGFDFDYFNRADNENTKYLKLKYKLQPENCPVIGVISRYIEWKGIQFIIPAFKQLLRNYPAAHLLLANSSGSYANQIRQLINDLPPGSYTEITFENEVSSLYKLFDVFVHVPVDEDSEAFGQTYVEALIMGVPSVFTLSGVAPEFIKHEFNALVVEYKNSEVIARAIDRILKNNDLKDTLVKEGKSSVQKFSLDGMISKLQSLYD